MRLIIKTYLTLCLTALCFIGGYAQTETPAGDKKEKIASLKVAFITERLKLTPEEAEKFWPVYNQYQDKLEELRKKQQEDRKKAKQNFDEMTDKDVEALIDSEMEFKQKQLNIIKEMHTKLKTVLPVKKIAKLYGSEEQFKKKLLQMVKEQKSK